MRLVQMKPVRGLFWTKKQRTLKQPPMAVEATSRSSQRHKRISFELSHKPYAKGTYVKYRQREGYQRLSLSELKKKQTLNINTKMEPGYLSLYCDWLRAGRPRKRSSNPGDIRFFSSSRRPDRLQGPTQLLHIRRVLGALSPGGGGKATGA
jgi:hypothetical protein